MPMHIGESEEEERRPGQEGSMGMVEEYEAQEMGNQNPLLGKMGEAFKSLTPQELQMIDQAITPEVGALLVKALGPGLGQIFKQFYQDDQPMQAAPVSPLQNVSAGGGY